ncbi:DUF11 domain-containing protein [Frigoribacterium sp. PhB24]|uniref:DUF11 domain-containing protein n=1 Tax=Frigoribacterium sp. PhB24 TaxID=2485204 RepID=UPI001315648F|nr:DUF11 domain-containing protein [Frigoribacterium sp. PhB24]
MTSAAPAAAIPFPDDSPAAYASTTVYINGASDAKTQLWETVRDDQGAFDFKARGNPAEYNYNALAFRAKDRMMYALTRGDNLIQIDATGAETANFGKLLGPLDQESQYNGATFGEGEYADTMFVQAQNPQNVIWAVDFASGSPSVRTIPLSEPISTADLAPAGGYLWGVTDGKWYRVDPKTGNVRAGKISGMGDNAHAIAAWTYPNGNLVFGMSPSSTEKLTVYQYDLQDAGGDPKFTLLASQSGPSADGADGTYVPNNPSFVDLSITKTASARVTAGDRIDYTMTVKNEASKVNSSGAIIQDKIPAGLSDVEVTDPGCSVTGDMVTCSVKRLAPGEEQSFQFSAATSTDTPQKVTNTAKVLPNDTDKVEKNNTSSATTIVEPAPDPDANSSSNSNSNSNTAADADANMNASASAGADSNANPAAQAAALADATTNASAAADSKANAAAKAAATQDASTDASKDAGASAEAAAKQAAQANASDQTQTKASAKANGDASSAAKAAAIADASKDASVNTNAATNANAAKTANANAATDATASAGTAANATASTATNASASAAAQGTQGAADGLHVATGGYVEQHPLAWPWLGLAAAGAAGLALLVGLFSRRRREEADSE